MSMSRPEFVPNLRRPQYGRKNSRGDTAPAFEISRQVSGSEDGVFRTTEDIRTQARGGLWGMGKKGGQVDEVGKKSIHEYVGERVRPSRNSPKFMYGNGEDSVVNAVSVRDRVRMMQGMAALEAVAAAAAGSRRSTGSKARGNGSAVVKNNGDTRPRSMGGGSEPTRDLGSNSIFQADPSKPNGSSRATVMIWKEQVSSSHYVGEDSSSDEDGDGDAAREDVSAGRTGRGDTPTSLMHRLVSQGGTIHMKNTKLCKTNRDLERPSVKAMENKASNIPAIECSDIIRRAEERVRRAEIHRAQADEAAREADNRARRLETRVQVLESKNRMIRKAKEEGSGAPVVSLEAEITAAYQQILQEMDMERSTLKQRITNLQRENEELLSRPVTTSPKGVALSTNSSLPTTRSPEYADSPGGLSALDLDEGDSSRQASTRGGGGQVGKEARARAWDVRGTIGSHRVSLVQLLTAAAPRGGEQKGLGRTTGASSAEARELGGREGPLEDGADADATPSNSLKGSPLPSQAAAAALSDLPWSQERMLWYGRVSLVVSAGCVGNPAATYCSLLLTDAALYVLETSSTDPGPGDEDHWFNSWSDSDSESGSSSSYFSPGPSPGPRLGGEDVGEEIESGGGAGQAGGAGGGGGGRRGRAQMSSEVLCRLKVQHVEQLSLPLKTMELANGDEVAVRSRAVVVHIKVAKGRAGKGRDRGRGHGQVGRSSEPNRGYLWVRCESNDARGELVEGICQWYLASRTATAKGGAGWGGVGEQSGVAVSAPEMAAEGDIELQVEQMEEREILGDLQEQGSINVVEALMGDMEVR
ncbi:unnamed protein product [Discosporangium mesarthrocarpum]